MVPAVVPVILAAGASSRMGRPKALLDFDGRCSLELVLAACRVAGLGPPVIVVSPSCHALMERVASAGIVASIVVNDHPERGQTSSLQTGLRHLPPADAFLIFPVDYVLVESVDVSAVIDAFCRPGPRRPPIVIPSWRNRRGHPVLVDLALRAEFLALTQGASARTVIDAHAAEIAYVQASCDSVLQDMDTPGDYRCCLDRLRQRG